jgi:histidine phosphotransferase ChpT
MLQVKGLAMNDLEFAALLVSRVCHDLVSPVGAVVNGLEVLEDETDLAMRADALRLVAASAEQAAARLKFCRIAFGAAGSAGAELDLTEIGRIMTALLKGGKVDLVWLGQPANWPKDWAKLLMNSVLAGVDCLPRGGRVMAETFGTPGSPAFRVTATGTTVRLTPEFERALAGEAEGNLDGRSVQAFLTYQLSKNVNAGLTVGSGPNEISFSAG